MLDRDQSGNGLEMKNIIVIAFSCLLALLLLHLPYAYSATIYLKNGGSIETDRYWEENNVLKCSKYGGLVEIPIADVLRIIDDKDGQSGELKNGFGFDIWRLGMSIEEVMKKAEQKDIGLHRTGFISSIKHFNPAKSRKYMHSHNVFCYADKLMGKAATVTLYLTPTSRKLNKIVTRLHRHDIHRKSAFRYEIEAMLRKKYGKPRKPMTGIGKSIFFDTLKWVVKGKYTVTMQVCTGQVDVIYSDKALTKRAKEEFDQIKARKREEYHRVDGLKF